ncbi:MAG TPA: hypothetical protein VH853_13040 [Polyangia bacterium]|jgi:hypothetical protein|nr:hypothetical protein [Polyangia bacterium]
MRSIVAAAGLLAFALGGCGGSSGGTAKTDGSSTDRPADMSGGAAGLGGGGGGAGAGGQAGGGGATGVAGSTGAGGVAGSSGAGGVAGAAGGRGGGAAGQGGAAARDGGADARSDGGGCPSQNPDPCICGRPDANSISAAACVREKACRAAGGVWEPYLVFLPEGGSYGPRCQSVDGSVLDAS